MKRPVSLITCEKYNRLMLCDGLCDDCMRTCKHCGDMLPAVKSRDGLVCPNCGKPLK